MNGSQINDSSDGIWDDGEWISWGYINSELGCYDEDAEGEKSLNECSWGELLLRAKEYDEGREETDKHFSIYGEIGELYVESRFGLIRHAPYTQGSDGKIGDLFVEVKTISPIRNSRRVKVKRAGNFGITARNLLFE